MPAAPPTDATRLPDLLADRLADRLADPDEVYTVFAEWAERQGTPLYPHQDEAVLALLAGENVVLSTPTGSGKSLVATAAHLSALASDRVSFYTAPIKALVSEKFFALCEVFGPSEVGMLTGDASVNPDAPIICCTAEILANITLREGSSADVGLVVMDEFHYYAEPDRGWAWQVPLLDLPQAQFLLMSATLGDVRGIADDLGRRTGRATTLVTGTERPVPLSFSWALTPLPETIEELLTTHQAPVYVVHFTQAAALEQAQALLALKGIDQGRPRGDRRADRRVPLHRRLRPHPVAAGPCRDRRAPRRDAAEVPPARRAARPGRPAQGGLRHGHPRGGHQRADPHGAVHGPGQVRRVAPARAARARVPPDRRVEPVVPASTPAARSSCRPPSTSSRTPAPSLGPATTPRSSRRSSGASRPAERCPGPSRPSTSSWPPSPSRSCPACGWTTA